MNIRHKPNEIYTTSLPYLPRRGDFLHIYTEDYEDEKAIIEGEVFKVVYYQTPDTKHAGDPQFDIYVRKHPEKQRKNDNNDKKEEDRKVITPAKLAERWNVSTTTIWRMEKKGELPPRKKLYKSYVWFKDDIEEFEKTRPEA